MADNLQPWPQQRQGYRPPPPGVQRAPFPVHPQTSGIPGYGGLSREERLEAKRLAEQANFSFEGYQVVRREFMSHLYDPAMTIRGNSITFNNSCISKLEDATYVHKCGHEWQATVSHRTNGTGCPFCADIENGKARRQKVINLDTGEIFDSAITAAKMYNVGPDAIRACVRGDTKRAGNPKSRWGIYKE